jgi:F0F1-type ATP synthase alpha subunit
MTGQVSAVSTTPTQAQPLVAKKSEQTLKQALAEYKTISRFIDSNPDLSKLPNKTILDLNSRLLKVINTIDKAIENKSTTQSQRESLYGPLQVARAYWFGVNLQRTERGL